MGGDGGKKLLKLLGMLYGSMQPVRMGKMKFREQRRSKCRDVFV
jgi:hypothetical protein